MERIHPSVRDPFADAMKSVDEMTIKDDALPFVKAAIAQKVKAGFLKLFGKKYHVSNKKLKELHDDLLQGALDNGYTVETFEKIWKDMMKILPTHNALIEFIEHDDVAHSHSYLQWVLDVMRDGDYGKAMMASLGQGTDLNGDPYEIGPRDCFYRGVVQGWTMVEARYRQMKARSALIHSKTAMILGGGYLPELSSKYGDNLPPDLTIVACDTNPRIPYREFEERYPGLIYKQMPMVELLNEHAGSHNFDTIIMDGVMSYNLDDFDIVMKLALSCLKPDGVILFDLQTMHLELLQIKLMLDWGDNADGSNNFKLLKADQAIKLVEENCAKLHVKCEHSHSGHYESTTCMLFEITNH